MTNLNIIQGPAYIFDVHIGFECDPAATKESLETTESTNRVFKLFADVKNFPIIFIK